MKKILFAHILLCSFLLFISHIHASSLPEFWMGNLTMLSYKSSVKKENLKISFLDILQDNRCPQGAQCIDAGSVTVLLKIGGKKIEVTYKKTYSFTYKKKTYQVKLIDMRPERLANKEFVKSNAVIYLEIKKI